MTDKTKPEPEIVIDGTAYPMPGDAFNGHEWAILKRVANITAGGIYTARKQGDVMFIYALGLIAMRRAGKDIDDNEILDLPIDKIDVKGVDESGASETDEDPTKADAEAADGDGKSDLAT